LRRVASLPRSVIEVCAALRLCEIHNLAARAAVHCCRHMPSQGARGFHRIVNKMGITRRCSWLRVTQQLADDN
jgi:hypothetical protein